MTLRVAHWLWASRMSVGLLDGMNAFPLLDRMLCTGRLQTNDHHRWIVRRRGRANSPHVAWPFHADGAGVSHRAGSRAAAEAGAVAPAPDGGERGGGDLRGNG